MNIQSTKDLEDAVCALANWFRSQEITTDEAITVMGLCLTTIIKVKHSCSEWQDIADDFKSRLDMCLSRP